MHRTSVLVTGASIAGPALAYWLHRYGMDVVVMERATELRLGGQTVDVRGAGKRVVQQMGLEDAIRARTTHEEGVAFVDEKNETRAAFDAQAFGGNGPVAELEILRGELAKLLVDTTKNDVDYHFGNSVTGLEDQGSQVKVRFERGPARHFDLVVAAEGIGSRTRRLVFGDEAKFRSFNLYTAYFTIPRTASDGTWARWFNAPGNRNVTLRPDNLGTTRALMSFQCSPRGYEKLEPEKQKELLAKIFADVGWEVPRVLAALESTPDFYFEAIGQVKLPRWSKGRIALTGDAAYCASPISGMGTSLALVGAFILAGELMRHPRDHRRAFESYESLMRPYVSQAQSIPTFAPRLASPRTRAGIAFGHAVLRLANRPIFKRVLGRVFSPPENDFRLPDYAQAPTSVGLQGIAT